MLAFWEYVAFLTNSFVFILIGMHIAAQPIDRLGAVAAVTAIAACAGRPRAR